MCSVDEIFKWMWWALEGRRSRQRSVINTMTSDNGSSMVIV